MATPELKDYLAAMYDFAGTLVPDYVRTNFGSQQRILDVGAGWGKYRWLLPEYEMDAVDIWQPYVEAEKLDAYYRKVFVQDLREFVPTERYVLAIMGDTLEHLSAAEAPAVVQRLCDHCDDLIIATPFLMPQEAVQGNPYEEHLQTDLTEAVMAERYPMLRLYSLSPEVPGNHRKAIYVKRGYE